MTIGVHFRVTDQSTCLKFWQWTSVSRQIREYGRTEDWDTMTFKKRNNKKKELPEN